MSRQFSAKILASIVFYDNDHGFSALNDEYVTYRSKLSEREVRALEHVLIFRACYLISLVE